VLVQLIVIHTCSSKEGDFFQSKIVVNDQWYDARCDSSAR
jgi:hypothetical protein